MSLEEITEFIDNKIEKNESKIEIGFYELKIQRNLTDEQVLSALYLISTRLMNLGYKVYRTNERYILNQQEYIVQTNLLLVGIK